MHSPECVPLLLQGTYGRKGGTPWLYASDHLERLIMSYEIMYGSMLTRIDVWSTDGRHVRTVYVHRSEYRTWGA